MASVAERTDRIMKKQSNESGHAYGYSIGSVLAIIVIVLLILWIL